ncbi:PaaI family thioesterase [Dickeya poaceiphila]|uniref:PaaI family thioesterase n=1 Tax=Dickeya poaceiphila TaxID=568768 RepID=A0A5B8HPE7_9GAMM|nr:PaaI family thioesterase [Dickeya poaceiphila]QDX31005.1 PaaI family thioesterase [Dickeya poaceiphila]
MIENELTSIFNDSVLFKTLGFSIIDIKDNSIVMTINDNNPCHEGGFGALTSIGINGAVISAALESAIGLCGFNTLGRKPAGVIEISVKILRIIRKKPCRIEAHVDIKNNHIAFISATLFSAHGSICATGAGIVLKSKINEGIA